MLSAALVVDDDPFCVDNNVGRDEEDGSSEPGLKPLQARMEAVSIAGIYTGFQIMTGIRQESGWSTDNLDPENIL